MHQADGKTNGFNAQEHLAKLRPGAVLLARNLSDPNFNGTAVLICQHGLQGSYGLVLNRPAHMPLTEIFDNPSTALRGLSKSLRVFIGGPVEAEELQVLQITSEPAPGSHAVAPGVHLGGYWEDLKDILGLDQESIRVFLGYSGWGKGQLASEISQETWEVWHVDLKKLLLGPQTAWQGGLASIRALFASLESK